MWNRIVGYFLQKQHLPNYTNDNPPYVRKAGFEDILVQVGIAEIGEDVDRPRTAYEVRVDKFPGG